jgi:hypothetical protein
MGGMGSGRRHQGGKATTSSGYPLDVRYLQRAGLMTPGRGISSLALIRIDPFLLTKADPRRGVGERRDVSPG